MVVYKNEGKDPNVWPHTLRHIHRLKESYLRNLDNRPRIAGGYYDRYNDTVLLILPLLERDWIKSFPEGTERIPGLDMGDVKEVVEWLATHKVVWAAMTWKDVREAIIEQMKKRRNPVPTALRENEG